MCCNNWSGTSTASSAYAASQCPCGRSRVVGYMPIVATYQVGSPVWNDGSDFAAASAFETNSDYDYYNSGNSCCCRY